MNEIIEGRKNLKKDLYLSMENIYTNSRNY